MILYLPYYDPASTDGISLQYWTDDTWLVNAQNEFLLILVTSWWDLASRIVVSLGFFASIESSISLIRVKWPQSTPQRKPAIVELPSLSALQEPQSEFASGQRIKWLQDTVRGRRLQIIAHVTLAIWGAVVLGLHIHAASLPDAAMCAMQVRPWLNTKSACALVVVDCYRDAQSQQTNDQLYERCYIFDPIRVTRLLIRHCSTLRMPALVRNYQAMTAMKVYNSTILDWSTGSALTTTDHPVFRIVALVRVEFLGGQLPDGLIHPDFPKAAIAVQICVSNLQSLPPDLDLKWPQRLYLLLEECQFDSFSPVLFGLRPVQVSLARNRFTIFPFEALAMDGLVILNMGGNRGITSLFPPLGTNVSQSLSLINIIDTNVSVLPNWFDDRLAPVLSTVTNGEPIRYPVIAASGTPFCSATRLIVSGSQNGYPELDRYQSERVSFVMKDATIADSLALCDILYDPLYYPLASEDDRYRLAS